MVNITNGKETFTVTNGAFETIFKSQGYSKVGDVKKAAKPAKQEEPEVTVENPESSADDFAALLEKPISQWSKTEVKDFAAAKGIDLQGTKNANEAKAIIKDFLEAADAE